MTAAPGPACQNPLAPPRRSGSFLLAAGVLVLLAAAATYTQVFNFDIFWHLAGGRWMLDHGRVLDTDPFSTDPLPRWVNVHWLFQVIVAAVHGAGGFAALSALKAALAVATVLLLALALRRGVPPAWLIVCGVLCVAVIETRFRVRPEAFTLLLLTATIALVEHVRRGGRVRWLWLLVPMTALWVNMHGLYVLGPAMFWSAALGAWVDSRLGRRVCGAMASRRAVLPLVVATAAALASPWPLEAAAQPLLLWTRISGQRAAFSQGVSEFLPTWQSPFYLALAVGAVVPAAGACLASLRRVPTAHWLWLAVFGALAMLARRNVALAGPICAYLLARHGGELWSRRRGRHRAPWAVATTGAAALVALGLAAGCATEWVFRLRGIHRRFGGGLYEAHYPVAAARFLAGLDVPGDVFCENWGDAGTFIYHARRRVFMDGRLEAHALERYLRQGRISQALRTTAGADSVELDRRLRFFFVRSLSGEHLRAMMASRRFRLVFIEPAGAVFARTDLPDGNGLAAGANLSALDRPLRRRDGRLEVEGLPVERRRWWRQNPTSPYYRLGAMLLWLGWRDAAGGAEDSAPPARRLLDLAIRYLAAATTDGISERPAAVGMLALANQHRALVEDVSPSPAVPVDYFSARALHLYGRLDLADLADENTRQFAEQRVAALVRARRLDAAVEAAGQMLRRLPADVDPSRRAAYRAMHEGLTRRLAASRRRARSVRLPYPQRARMLAGPEMGLAEQAIAELRGAPPSPENLLALADLLLNAGRVGQARRVCERLRGANGPTEALRRARLDWADLLARPEALLDGGSTNRAPTDDVGRYYRALVWEQYGYGRRAIEELSDVVPADGQLRRLVEGVRRAAALAGPGP